jgi:hypothetical protein
MDPFGNGGGNQQEAPANDAAKAPLVDATDLKVKNPSSGALAALGIQGHFIVENGNIFIGL